MGAAPPWGQSLLRSCLAAHSFPPPPPATCCPPSERHCHRCGRSLSFGSLSLSLSLSLCVSLGLSGSLLGSLWVSLFLSGSPLGLQLSLARSPLTCGSGRVI